MTRIFLAVFMMSVVSAADLPSRVTVETHIHEAQAWCLAQQKDDGSFAPDATFSIGITALTALALLDEPGLPSDHPAIQKALRFVMAHKQPDGGVYDPDEGLANYGTSLALRLLVKTGADEAEISALRNWIFGQQNVDPDSKGVGGMGYGKGPGTEDVSNTVYALQALRESGVPAEDPKMQKALDFLEHCQDLTSVNAAAWAGKSEDSHGGAVYSPTEAGGSWEEKAEGASPEKFTPSGTMTYSLISGYLALDLGPEDPRVKAALDYVRRHYGFSANPGMSEGKERQGLFHYYGLMGRTFTLLQQDQLTLSNGSEADWRADLWQHLIAESTPVVLDDGSPGRIWINSATRWGEGMPHLATVYALHAMKAIYQRLP